MANPAPMPRWYDMPIVWFGAQVLVLVGLSAILRWVHPGLHETRGAVLLGAGIVIAFIASYRLQRYLRARDDTRRSPH